MKNLEFEREIIPFPVDPNKLKINKWMFAMGLPVPEIYNTPEEVEAALDQYIPVLARGYLIDKKAHIRPFLC